MNQKSAPPKDASAVILLDESETRVLWAQRNPGIKFLGGWHAFPGGKTESADREIEVGNCRSDGEELARFIVAAARELFEEVGVLLARGGEKLTKGQRASLHDDLVSGRSSFAEILADWGLRLDAEDFLYTGFWTTPEFSPVRFKTRFFIAKCPPKQTPYAAITELQTPEFIAPAEALEKWANSEVLISPPVLIALQTLAQNGFSITDKYGFERTKNDSKTENQILKTKNQNLKTIAQTLLEKSDKAAGAINHIELNPHITVFPLKTETLPPATHTNCFIVGHREFVVIDAAAKDESEQAKLHALIDSRIENGALCRSIIVSHLHEDHVGGEIALQRHLRAKFNVEIPIAAHALTAESLKERIAIEKFIADGEQIELKDKNGAAFYLTTLELPEHARGHLCFYDAAKGFLLSSDNVVGAGTVLIAPPEGNMIDYLASLEKMKNLANLRFLCGSHGAAVFDARGKIEEYIAHREERERQILAAIQTGAKTTREIAHEVYTGFDEELFALAEKSVAAHLEKLRFEGRF